MNISSVWDIARSEQSMNFEFYGHDDLCIKLKEQSKGQ